MLDREGYRPNVGIILLNARNQVFWGKRLRTHSWQFPQGGIKYGESPEQAMFRELHEEVGLHPDHVQILARTRDWLRYEVPDHFIRKDARGHYKGQKQIWFLLRLMGRDSDLDLTALVTTGEAIARTLGPEPVLIIEDVELLDEASAAHKNGEVTRSVITFP